MEAIKALLKQVTAFWEGKDKRFRRTVIIVAAVVLAAIVISSILLNQVPYAVLYSGLQPQDSTAVLEALKEQKVASRVSGDTILVPASQADSLRLSLSGVVQNGFSLDILKQGQGLGMTESDKQDYRRYQTQSDIRNSILTLKGVKDVRVAITMPTESILVIDENRQEATAGVILTMDPGVELTLAQVNSIALFVQKAVKGLEMDNISIMDSNMRNLDVSGSDDTEVSANDRYALQYDVQSKLRKQIMALLQPVFGIGKVEAQVNVALDFDDRTVESVKFEPVVGKNGIVVSIDKLREQIVNGQSASGTAAPGTDSNTGSGTTTYPVVNVDNGTYEKNAEKINYEINSIKEQLVEEKGAIKSLSVSVVIDNTGAKEDYTENVKNLVATAVGVDKGLISVEYLPMMGVQSLNDSIAKDLENEAAARKLQDLMPLIIVGAIAMVVIVAMVLLFSSRKPKAKVAVAQPVAAYAAEAPEGGGELDEEPLEEIRIVKESGTKEQIGKLIKDNPELVANLLRSWLAEED